MPKNINVPIIFLHIPKTAGQTIHSGLIDCVGKEQVSPVRVHTQVTSTKDQFPLGFRVYSGHLDWDELDLIFPEKFSFTVLRDPLERLASFYLYLKTKADLSTNAKLLLPENFGLKMISSKSIEEYFFGGDANWQKFILDHYFNPYCSYFISKKIRGYNSLRSLNHSSIINAALDASQNISRIYHINDLQELERDMQQVLSLDLSVKTKRVNVGPANQNKSRWSQFTQLIESDSLINKIKDMVELDNKLITKLFPQNH